MGLSALALPAPPDGCRAVAELAPAARQVLAAIRATIAEGLSPCAALASARLGAEGVAAFAAMLGVFRAAGHAAPSVLPLEEAWLSADEAALLDCLGALQSGAPWRAQRLLASWFPPCAVPRAIGLVALSARHLARAGLWLAPCRVAETLH